MRILLSAGIFWGPSVRGQCCRPAAAHEPSRPLPFLAVSEGSPRDVSAAREGRVEAPGRGEWLLPHRQGEAGAGCGA